MSKFYHFISYLFFPGTLAIAGFALVRHFSDSSIDARVLAFPTGMFLAGPAGIMIFLLRAGLVDDIHVSKREQRIFSYLVAIAFALVFVVLQPNESWLWQRWGMAVLGTLCALFLVNTFFLKASAHMAGSGGFLMLTLLGYVYHEPITWVAASGILSFLIYISRYGLAAHTHKELISGFSLGFLVTWLCFRF